MLHIVLSQEQHACLQHCGLNRSTQETWLVHAQSAHHKLQSSSNCNAATTAILCATALSIQCYDVSALQVNSRYIHMCDGLPTQTSAIIRRYTQPNTVRGLHTSPGATTMCDLHTSAMRSPTFKIQKCIFMCAHFTAIWCGFETISSFRATNPAGLTRGLVFNIFRWHSPPFRCVAAQVPRGLALLRFLNLYIIKF